MIVKLSPMTALLAGNRMQGYYATWEENGEQTGKSFLSAVGPTTDSLVMSQMEAFFAARFPEENIVFKQWEGSDYRNRQ